MSNMPGKDRISGRLSVIFEKKRSAVVNPAKAVVKYSKRVFPFYRDNLRESK